MKALRFLPLLVTLTLLTFACTKEDENTDSEQEQNSAVIMLDAGSTAKAGDLDDGQVLSSLDWAWRSSNSCFVTPTAHRYEGNHVFYATELPANSVMTINLIPDDPNSKMAVYGYSRVAGTAILPQDLDTCVSCKADPATDNGSSDTGDRTIELRATQIFENIPQSPYTVVIGVAGAKDVTSGSYTLEVILDK